MTPAEFRATDVQFHLYLGEVCGNARLRDYLRSFFDEYQGSRDRFPIRHLADAAVQGQRDYFEATLAVTLPVSKRRSTIISVLLKNSSSGLGSGSTRHLATRGEYRRNSQRRGRRAP